MSRSAELTLQNVTKRFFDFCAVDDISFSVPPGSYVVLLGPSGSGKTTLLSMLGGFLLPTEGAIRIGEDDFARLPPARRPTATVFQDYALFPHLNVAQNVGFGLSIRKMARGEIATRVAAMLRLVGLENMGERRISMTSGGQRQRIALARALITEPALLLLDEPLGALDLSLRRQMQDELRRIQRAAARTFVHVTHDQEEAMAIADTVVIMNKGRIEDMGPPQRVYERPRTRFAARFMGESALIEGKIIEANGTEMSVDTVFGRLHAPGCCRAAAQPVTLGLRPEAIRLGSVRPDDQTLGSLLIEETVYQGSFVRVTGATPTGFRLTAKVDPSTPVGVGHTVAISTNARNLIALED
jgi:spermidine/putrescine transport system ATP-binding protein